MKKIFKTILLVTVLACSGPDNVLEDVTFPGGYIQFLDVPENRFNFFDFTTFEFSGEIVDRNDNASGYSLTMYFKDIKVDDFLIINSFPATLNINGQMILDALGVPVEDLADEELEFVATVVSDTGTYVGQQPDFDPDTGELIGNTTPRLFRPGQKDAMNFSITFFLPPPKTVAFTSFEVPEAVGGDYIKELAADEDEDLMNHPGEPIVDFIASGGEIGFNSEFFGTGASGFAEEEIGVTSDVSEVSSFTDGTQGFKLEDIDGLYRLTFDKVGIPTGEEAGGAQVKAFLAETTWEDEDLLLIKVMIEMQDGSEDIIELINTTDQDINDDYPDLEGRWTTFDTGFIAGAKSLTVVIDVINSSGAEEIYFDEVRIYVPE